MRWTVLTLAVLVLIATAQGVTGVAGTAQAMELCGAQAKVLMQSVGITANQIKQLCQKAELSEALLSLSLTRAVNELGYCRVTLALNNNSTEYLNLLVLSSHQGHFDAFRFHNILPGGTGYASANSTILMGCDELATLKLTFLWPISLRMGDRARTGQTLRRYQPLLRSPLMAWNP